MYCHVSIIQLTGIQKTTSIPLLSQDHLWCEVFCSSIVAVKMPLPWSPIHLAFIPHLVCTHHAPIT